MPEAPAKKPTFRTAVGEFAEQHFGKGLGKLGHNQLHEAVLRCYLKNVYAFTTEPLTEAEIDEGLCDGKDAGVDFLRRDNERVLIIQAKHRSDGEATEILEDLSYFQDVLRRLHPVLGTAWKKNKKLTELVGEIDYENDTFHLEYITLGRIHSSAEDVLATGIKELALVPDLQARTTLTFFDETGLNNQYRIALSQSGGIPDSVELFLAAPSTRTQAAIELSAPHKTLLGVVTGTTLANVYRQHREPLFTLNIRSFLGRNKTNKDIIATIKNDPESFLNYNNGITCLCKGYDWDPGSRRLIAHKFQVVNGAQTIRCLVAAGKTLSDKVLVPIKLTAIEDYYRADEERFYTNVIKYSNTQNIIKDIDFRSNDPIQADLQRRFAELTYRGRRVYYQIKRTDKKPAGAIYTIPIAEFCKNLYSFFFNPTDFASKSSFLFDDTEDKGYSRLFGDGKEVFVAATKEQFQLFSAAWFCCELFSEWRAGDRQRLAAEGLEVDANAIERTYFLFGALHLLLAKRYAEDDWRTHLRKYWKPDWCDDSQNHKYKVTSDYYDLAKGVVTACYKEAAALPGFNHRNWTRSPATFQRIQHHIQHLVPSKFIPEL